MDPDVDNWAARLLPERVDPALRFPSDTLLLYQALSWTRPLSTSTSTSTATSTSCRAQESWSTHVTTAGYETEQGFLSWASIADEVVARMLIVVRHPRPGQLEGTSRLPEPPAVPMHEADEPCVLSESEVQDFVAGVDGRYPVAKDASFARDHGHASVIIPGTLLMVRAARSAMAASQGTVEMWFRHSVPVGALLMRRRCADSGVESFHLAGRSEPSALLCLSPESSDELPPGVRPSAVPA